MIDIQVSVANKCGACALKEPVGRRNGVIVHCVRDGSRKATWLYFPCVNFDSECRHIGEPFGYFTVAWLPKRCRNGRVRWLRWVEQHDDGTFTLGNRAH